MIKRLVNDLKNKTRNKIKTFLIQWGISEVRSMATNQRVLKSNALITPAPNPNRSIVVGINKGNTKAPTKGVKATNNRTIN